ncbi:ABC transporter substrate-binding protein [Rhodopirellula sallentina]|uniref:Nitrate/sulfonate/bicarbonate ABC transporter substrate-binding protein n=1 Tax=Rhodopirellula sallentina SM41 TaxID=1263870 RepID=M5UPQ6_9BACT|nr:ABC transporter substrate-binding protein [Rhodopirellula sallentina]EMI57988.1 nitrate/sulfonate/bicarbonate ABC transporter substrate-binding protein [Rhodopirellula sallentina SM41]
MFDRNRANLACSFGLLLLALPLVGCSNRNSTSSQPDGDQPTRVRVQLNWYPEVEHGGVYQAAIDGTYEAQNLDVEINPGGSETPIAPELLLGRSQFAITNADDVVLFRSQGADIVAVLAAVQQHPRCLLVREDSGVETFEDLSGMTLQCQPGRTFLPFLRQRGYLEGVREVPYFNSIAAMINDPKVAVQAYAIAEPLLARQQGIEVRTLMVSDLGWNPYSSVLVTTGDLIRENPDLVQTFVSATRAGWENYLASPQKANEQILSENKHGMTAEVLQYGAEQMRELTTSPDETELGQMTLSRWQTLVDQMKELDVIKKDAVQAEECFTTEFVQNK